jgi:hypothetical protein
MKKLILLILFSTFTGLLFLNCNQSKEQKVGSCSYYDTKTFEMIFKLYDDFFKEKPQLNSLEDLQFKDGERSFKGKGYTFDDGVNQFDYYNIYGILNGEHLWIMYRNRKDHVDRKVDFDFINCLIKELKFKSN